LQHEPEKLEAGDNVLDLNNVPGERSEVRGSQTPADKNGDKISYTGNRGKIYRQDQSKAKIFHESMHFLGLTDRYNDIPNTNPVQSESHKGFENDVMGAGGSGKISQIHYNNWGKAAVSKGNGVIRTRVDLDKKGILIYSPSESLEEDSDELKSFLIGFPLLPIRVTRRGL